MQAMVGGNGGPPQQPDPYEGLVLSWQVFQQLEFNAHDLFRVIALHLPQEPANSGEGESQIITNGEELATVIPYKILYMPVDLRPVRERVIHRLAVGRSLFVILRDIGSITVYTDGERAGESEITSFHALDLHTSLTTPPVEMYTRPEITMHYNVEGGLIDEHFGPSYNEAGAARHEPPSPLSSELRSMFVEQDRYVSILGTVAAVSALG